MDDGQFKRRVRQVGILTEEEVAQVAPEDHFVGRAVEFDSGGVAVAELLQAGDGGEFEFGLGPPPVRHGYPPVSRRRGREVRRTSVWGGGRRAGRRECRSSYD